MLGGCYSEYDAGMVMAPVAVAGSDMEVEVSTSKYVSLDGTASYDPNLQDGAASDLKYEWQIVQKPASSTILSLLKYRTANPQLLADKEGMYVISLVVYSGDLVSEPDYVTIYAVAPGKVISNGDLPSAVIAPLGRYCPQETITFDGSASRSGKQGGELSYKWEKVTGKYNIDFADNGAAVTTAPAPASFDSAVDYVVSLTVDDGANKVTEEENFKVMSTVARITGPTSVPAGQSFTLSAANSCSTANINSYLWSIVGGNGSLISENSGEEVTIMPNNAGTIEVSLIIGGKSNSQTSYSVTVN